ncbi:colicin FY [Yersinia enterocolitica]|uniref:Colicin FY n=1 Tax=Yersinia frederiksenii TaxID=29484 RepID=H8YUQ0_YERFR|nr:colicin FY [Yersinia frederiksenii]AFC36229.1 colicin FY [Yersinia frederiksenii]
MTDYKDVDPFERQVMESLGYGWVSQGEGSWQKGEISGAIDNDTMTVTGWNGAIPTSPSGRPHIWDQKISELNNARQNSIDDNDDDVTPTSDHEKNQRREASAKALKYTSDIESKVNEQLNVINNDIQKTEAEYKEKQGGLSEVDKAKYQLVLSKLQLQKQNAKILSEEAKKRRVHAEWEQINDENVLNARDRPSAEWRQQREINSKKSLAKLAEERAVQEQVELIRQGLAQLEKNILANKENVKRWTEEMNKNKEKEENEVKDALKFTADFYKTVTEKYGEKSSKIAQELADAAKGKQIRSVDEALKAFDKYKDVLNKKFSVKDREAIAKALESVDRELMAKNLAKFSKAFNYVGKTIDRYDTLKEIQKALETNNWRPVFVQLESLAVGRAAGAITAFAFSIIIGAPLGILGVALIMALVSVFVDDRFIEKINEMVGV